MRTNENRTIGFALKSRLPSVFVTRQAVDAGGLMYYGADLADSYRRVAYFVDRILKGSQARRSTGGATEKVRIHHQSENREANRPDDPAERAGAGGQGDQVMEENQAALPGLN